MIKNENTISRESSKEKVDRIHRLRVEIEKIREENAFLLNKLEKYDDWLYNSIDEINSLLDKNISEDSYDYEEESIEYDFDPNDLNFGEKKRSNSQLKKPPKKINIENDGERINNKCDNGINSQNLLQLTQIKPNIGRTKKDKTECHQNFSKDTAKQIIKTPQIQTSKLIPSVSTEGSSPLEMLFKLNPQLAAQILRPFIEEYKKKISQNTKEKENNTNAKSEIDQNNTSENKIDTISKNETENTDNLLSKEKSLKKESKDEESFDDL